MKWQGRTREEKDAVRMKRHMEKQQWRKWFAWYPVKCDKTAVVYWGQWVMRKDRYITVNSNHWLHYYKDME